MRLFFLFLIFTFCVLFHSESLKSDIVDLPGEIELINEGQFQGKLIVSRPDVYNHRAAIFFNFPKEYLDFAYQLLELHVVQIEDSFSPVSSKSRNYSFFVGEVGTSSTHPSPNVPEKNQIFLLTPLRYEFTITPYLDKNDIKLVKTWYLVSSVLGLDEVHSKYKASQNDNWPHNGEFRFEIAEQVKIVSTS